MIYGKLCEKEGNGVMFEVISRICSEHCSALAFKKLFDSSQLNVDPKIIPKTPLQQLFGWLGFWGDCRRSRYIGVSQYL